MVFLHGHICAKARGFIIAIWFLWPMLQALYGSRGNQPPDLCSNSSFDAIFEYPAGVIYVLKGEVRWIQCVCQSRFQLVHF
jgi:hypothetical protein